MTAPKFCLLAVLALLMASEAGAGDIAGTPPVAAPAATEVQHLPVPSLEPVLLNAKTDASSTADTDPATGTAATTGAEAAISVTEKSDAEKPGAAKTGGTTPEPAEVKTSPETEIVQDTSTATASASVTSAPTSDAASAGATARSAAPAADAPKPEAATTEAAAAPPPPPAPTLLIDIDLTSQRMSVTENGTQKHTWPISSARAGYRTPAGTFKPQWMSKMWYSRQYDYSPMPHAIFFSGGTAIHATYATGALGRPASHGCVRLAPGNAATIFKLVNKHGKDLTRITVHGTPRYREPAVAGRRDSRRYASASRSSRYVQGYYGGYAYYAPSAQSPRAYYTKRQRRVVQRGYYSGYSYGY